MEKRNLVSEMKDARNEERFVMFDIEKYGVYFIKIQTSKLLRFNLEQIQFEILDTTFVGNFLDES